MIVGIHFRRKEKNPLSSEMQKCHVMNTQTIKNSIYEVNLRNLRKSL